MHFLFRTTGNARLGFNLLPVNPSATDALSAAMDVDR